MSKELQQKYDECFNDKEKLTIIYTVQKVVDGFCGIRYSDAQSFDNLSDAIELHKQQEQKEYSWWEIHVEYFSV